MRDKNAREYIPGRPRANTSRTHVIGLLSVRIGAVEATQLNGSNTITCYGLEEGKKAKKVRCYEGKDGRRKADRSQTWLQKCPSFVQAELPSRQSFVPALLRLTRL